MCTAIRSILPEIFSDENRGSESVDFAPRCGMGARFLLVGCGWLDLIFVPFARPHRIHPLSGPDHWRAVHFFAQIESRLAGFSVGYQATAPAIAPAAPGHIPGNTYIGPYWRLNLSPE